MRIAFIEVFRGMPLITLLFMSQVLVPLAFPENFPQNSLFRAGVIITLFSGAYMAENIRGGLQALRTPDRRRPPVPWVCPAGRPPRSSCCRKPFAT